MLTPISTRSSLIWHNAFQVKVACNSSSRSIFQSRSSIADVQSDYMTTNDVAYVLRCVNACRFISRSQKKKPNWKTWKTTRDELNEKDTKKRKGHPVPRSRRLTKTLTQTTIVPATHDKIRSFSSATTSVSRFLTASDLERTSQDVRLPQTSVDVAKLKKSKSVQGCLYLITLPDTCSDVACRHGFTAVYRTSLNFLCCFSLQPAVSVVSIFPSCPRNGRTRRRCRLTEWRPPWKNQCFQCRSYSSVPILLSYMPPCA